VGADPCTAVTLPLHVAETGVTTSTTDVTITASVPPLSLLPQAAKTRISMNVYDLKKENPIFKPVLYGGCE
jgi:hypothetical protein